MPKRWAFDFVTTVKSLRGRERAMSNAKRMIPFDARTRENRNLGRNFNVRAAMRPPAVTPNIHPPSSRE